MLLCKFLINTTEFSFALGTLSKGQRVWFRISEAFSGVMIALAAMMSLWMIALGVNYKQGVWTLIKNSFLMTIGMLPQSLFFGVLALLPFGLFLIGGGLFSVIGGMPLILFDFAHALLVWLDFTQWAFDKFINPKIEGAKVGRGIYNKDGSSSSRAATAKPRSPISALFSPQAIAARRPSHQAHRRLASGLRAASGVYPRGPATAEGKQAEHRGRHRRLRAGTQKRQEVRGL
ncbi:MAG: hypothetical protein ACLRSW_02410 [Christensenellaceae bacterium]